MPNSQLVAPQAVDETDDLAIAQEELAVLEKLAEAITENLKEFSKTRGFEGRIDNNQLALAEHNYARFKAYEELADACYGRTVVGIEVDENEKPKVSFVYRVTQANIGYADRSCYVIARNSPLATQLVTALPGDNRDVVTKTRERYLNVDQVRTFDGPVSLLSRSQLPNFRSTTVRKRGLRRPAILGDLRAIVRASLSRASAAAVTEVSEPLTTHRDVEPGWLGDWSSVYLGESDESSLGHQFFTQTTVDQERALNNPRGVTFVEGVAGSGKTSVALGRVKFFANFATGGEREHYGLQNAPEADFSPTNMAGFVLSPSLKRYLKDTAGALGLERLPIRDFEEFRIDVCGRFGITEKFKRRKGDVRPIRGRLNWLRAIDSTAARSAGRRLRENLDGISGASALVQTEVGKIIEALLQAEPQGDSGSFNLDGLAQRIATVVADAEFRTHEARIGQEYRVRQTIEDERQRRELASLERQLRLLQEGLERRLVSPLINRLLSGITAVDLVYPAVQSDELSTLVLRAFGYPAGRPMPADLSEAVGDLRQALHDSRGRPALPDGDLVVLTIMAGMIADGFDYLDQSGGLKHLYQMRRHTAVFIDEVQDFTETEIFLMGMTAAAPYYQITLSGDRKQRLQVAGTEAYDNLFPKVSRQNHNRAFFLDHNFRQRNELAALSAGFRKLIQGDHTAIYEGGDVLRSIPLHIYSSAEQMADFMLRKIRLIPRNATIAVICPAVADAEKWFKLLEDELSSHHRPPRLSRRGDLTRRVNVHFTEVGETKGLEFDVVVAPDFTSFAMDTEIGRNQAYVAVSRPRHAIILGCSRQGSSRSEIGVLVRAGLLRLEDVALQ